MMILVKIDRLTVDHKSFDLIHEGTIQIIAGQKNWNINKKILVLTCYWKEKKERKPLLLEELEEKEEEKRGI